MAGIAVDDRGRIRRRLSAACRVAGGRARLAGGSLVPRSRARLATGEPQAGQRPFNCRTHAAFQRAATIPISKGRRRTRSSPDGLLSTLARPWGLLVVLTATLAAITVATLPDSRLHLTVMDVGQGDGILVVTPAGRSMLVDAGPDPDQTLRQLGAKMPWWRRSIDVIVLTHPHQDHVGGFPQVLRRFRVATILDSGRPYQNPTYDRFVELSRAERGASYRLARAGQRLDLDQRTTFRVWYPSADDAARPLPEGDINNASVVGLLQL